MRDLCIAGNGAAGCDPPDAVEEEPAAAFFGLAGLGREARWLLGFLGLLLMSIFRFCVSARRAGN
jgi:hypothetical protein